MEGKEPAMTQSERLEAAILEEQGALNPCADVLAYLYSLRGKSDDVLCEALDEMN